MEDLLRAFGITAAVTGWTQLSGGHIHGTYRVQTADGVYIAQKLHPTAFPEPEALMERMVRITDVLRENGEVSLHFYPACGGWLHDGWRVMDCIPGVHLTADDGAEVITAAGEMFGRFSAKLRGISLDAHSIHDPVRWFAALRGAIAADPLGRLAGAGGLTARLLAREADACAVTRMGLPERILHGDTKLTNLLFDPDTCKPLAVIDLDTVGMGLAAYDFGDAVRSLHGSRETMDLAILRRFTDGYLAGAEFLTPAERESLLPGVLAITAELAARYLADYLTGDRYFRNPDSLNRAASLTALAEDIAGRMQG